jgi:hypothetical protein
LSFTDVIEGLVEVVNHKISIEILRKLVYMRVTRDGMFISDEALEQLKNAWERKVRVDALKIYGMTEDRIVVCGSSKALQMFLEYLPNAIAGSGVNAKYQIEDDCVIIFK